MIRKCLFAAIAGGLLLASGQAVTADGAGSLSSTDRTFLKQVSQGNLAEIQTNRLALQKSKNPQIQNIAGRLATEHTQAQNDLRSVARHLGITLPSAPSTEQQQMYQRLAALSGGLFEESYLRSQAAAHNVTIGLFQKEMANGSNSRVQGYVARYLPKIQNHAAMIFQTAHVMGVVVPRPSKVAAASSGAPIAAGDVIPMAAQAQDNGRTAPPPEIEAEERTEKTGFRGSAAADDETRAPEEENDSGIEGDPRPPHEMQPPTREQY